MTIVIIIVIIATVVYYTSKKAKAAKLAKAPMYPQYINLDERYHYWTSEQRSGQKSFVCPWCRKSMYQISTTINYWGPFCNECNEEIRQLAFADQRPSYVDQHDWKYLVKGNRYWVIYRDHELGFITDKQAQELMHSLVLKNGGTIEPIKYRGWHSYASYAHSHLDSTISPTCQVCQKFTCECSEMYAKDMNDKKWPKLLTPQLDQLRALNPTIVLDYYYRKEDADSSKTYVKTKVRDGFSIEDYYTEDDWRTVRWLANHLLNGEYEEWAVEKAINQYFSLIMKDFDLLIRYHEDVKLGKQVQFPFLPSTNPAEIKIKKKVGEKYENANDRLLKKFY